MKTNGYRGGQGRSAADVQADGAAMLWMAMAAIVLIAGLVMGGGR